MLTIPPFIYRANNHIRRNVMFNFCVSVIVIILVGIIVILDSADTRCADGIG